MAIDMRQQQPEMLNERLLSITVAGAQRMIDVLLCETKTQRLERQVPHGRLLLSRQQEKERQTAFQTEKKDQDKERLKKWTR